MPHEAHTETEETREIREGHPNENGTPMTYTQNNTQSLQSAVNHARRLTEHGRTQHTTAAWMAQAHHVGDLSVLALALRA